MALSCKSQCREVAKKNRQAVGTGGFWCPYKRELTHFLRLWPGKAEVPKIKEETGHVLAQSVQSREYSNTNAPYWQEVADYKALRTLSVRYELRA